MKKHDVMPHTVWFMVMCVSLLLANVAIIISIFLYLKINRTLDGYDTYIQCSPLHDFHYYIQTPFIQTSQIDADNNTTLIKELNKFIENVNEFAQRAQGKESFSAKDVYDAYHLGFGISQVFIVLDTGLITATPFILALNMMIPVDLGLLIFSIFSWFKSFTAYHKEKDYRWVI